MFIMQIGSICSKPLKRILVTLASKVLAVNAQMQTNLIADGDFSMANLSGLTYRYFPSLPGWNCTTSCELIDNYFICFLSGITHQVLFNYPNLQLLMLVLIEGVWMTFKICSLKIYRKKFTEFVMFTSGLIRMCFIFTFYFYQKENHMRYLINKSVHKMLVATLLILWLKQFTVSSMQLLSFYYKFWKKINFVQPKKTQSMIDIIKPASPTKLTNDIASTHSVQKNSRYSLKTLKRNPIIRSTNNHRSQFKRINIIRGRLARIVSFQKEQKIIHQ